MDTLAGYKEASLSRNRQMMPWGYIPRWWRSQGFGVHSPFAFRMVRDVLLPRYRYYDDDALRFLPLSRRCRRYAGVLFRLAARLAPASFMIIAGEESDALAEAVHLASPNCIRDAVHRVPAEKNGALVFLGGDEGRRAFPAVGNALAVVADFPFPDEMHPERGVLLRGICGFIWFPQAESQFVAYDILIR